MGLVVCFIGRRAYLDNSESWDGTRPTISYSARVCLCPSPRTVVVLDGIGCRDIERRVYKAHR